MRDIFNFELLNQFNKEYYANILSLSHLYSDEIAIKNKETEENEYFYIMKKSKTSYLLPSKFIEDLPIKIIETKKIPYKSKAYELITKFKSVNIKEEKIYSFKELINNFLPYQHEEPDQYTLWKIIIKTAYDDRINVRCISYPGWGKDSPLSVLKLLFGDVALVNKPNYAKLKKLLNGAPKILGLNEIENIKPESVREMSKYYEDTGNFAPEWVNDTRATTGTVEEISLANHSSLTFYNFPETESEKVFDKLFKPKVRARILPILLIGGSNTTSGMLHKFSYIEPYITQEEKEEIIKFIRSWRYYENHWLEEYKNKKQYKQLHHFDNVRWERSYTAICKRINLYAEDEKEYNKYENLLFTLINMYEDYVNKYNKNEIKVDQQIKIEEEMV